MNTTTYGSLLPLLADNSKKEVLVLYQVADSLKKLNIELRGEAIKKIEGKISPADHRSYSKLLFLKSYLLIPSSQAAYDQIRTAIGIAEQSDEERLVAAYCHQYTMLLLRSRPDNKTAALYGVKSIELQRKIGFQYYPYVPEFQLAVARVLYNTKNYPESIRYYRELLIGDISMFSNREIASAYNSFAFCYRDQGMYDSAMHWYQKGWEIAQEKKVPVWTWLLRGNQAYIHLAQQRYDSAEVIAGWYYDECVKAEAWALAAKAQTMISSARIGRKDYNGALRALLKADSFISHYPMTPYEEHSATYQNLALVYEKMGAADKAYDQYKKYIWIRDSIDHSLTETIVGNFKTKISFDKAETSIRLLQQEKKSEQLKRNLIIGLVALLGIISFLLLNRQRLRLLHKNQFAIQQKNAAEAETSAAKKELELFTRNFVEKNKLIDNLQEQLHEERFHQDVQTKVEMLKQQVILTEDDWQNFKTIFEKVHPHFFDQLRKMAPDITGAEQRMAALVRLFPDNRQIASVLGISVDSVRKTKRRLSQRLSVDTEKVEELILKLSRTA
jgi:tetratricopeptide (TPR) repeat protein